MLLQRIGDVRIHSPVGLGQQLKGHRHDEQVVAAQVGGFVLLFDDSGHILGIVNGALVGLENILAELLKILLKIRRMAGKVYSGFALGAGVAFCFHLKFSHNVLLRSVVYTDKQLPSTFFARLL